MVKKVDFSLEYRDLSIHTNNPFVEHNSSPRSSMFASHINQALVLKDSDIPNIVTGGEKRLGELALDITVPEDGVVEAVINRRCGADNHVVETLIIYYGYESKKIDCIKVPKYITNHQYFGYELKINGALPAPQDKIYKDQILAWTPNRYGKGINEPWYGYGRNLNTAFMDLQSVAEDGFIISESALQKLGFTIYETRDIDIHKNSDMLEGYPSINIPLNIYGEEDYKIFPDIGMQVRHDAVVAAVRRIRLSRYGSKASMEALRRLEFVTDSITYTRNNTGVVVDVQVIKSLQLPISNLPPYRQLEEYVQYGRSYYKRILDVENAISRKYRANITGSLYHPRFMSVLEEARTQIGALINAKSRGIKEKSIRYTYQKDPIGDYRLILTIKHDILPNIGSKLSDRAGGKGVIVEIRKDDEMPVDQYGVRAEVIVDKNSIISRMNPGRFYEQAYNHAVYHTGRKMRETLTMGNITDINNIDTNRKQEAVDYLKGFLEIISPKHKKALEEATQEEIDNMLEQVIFDGLYIYKDIKDHGEPIRIMEDLMNSIYYPSHTTVTWKGIDGKTVTTLNTVLIAPTYIMLLEKIGDSGMAVSSPRSNHIGVPVKLPKHSKNKYPIRHNPVRMPGESETRLIAAYGKERAIAEIMDQGTNPDTHRIIYRAILEADKPTAIHKAVDRNKHPLGKSIPVSIIGHIYYCQGIEDVYVKTGD